MKEKTVGHFDSSDLGTIDRLITHFEKQKLAAYKKRDPVDDYGASLEYHKRLTGFGGAVSSLKELRELILSQEKRG